MTRAGMLALTVRQPWPLAMLYARPPKRIENRTWSTDYRGPLLIHASKGCTRREWDDAIAWMGADARDLAAFGPYDRAPRGGIVAIAQLVDVISPDDHAHKLARDPWYTGDGYGWVLDDVRPTRFAPCAGALKLWTPLPPTIDYALAGDVSKPYPYKRQQAIPVQTSRTMIGEQNKLARAMLYAGRRRIARDRVKRGGARPLRVPCEMGDVVIVHRSTVKPGWWQASYFDASGDPWGDSECDDFGRLLDHVDMGGLRINWKAAEVFG